MKTRAHKQSLPRRADEHPAGNRAEARYTLVITRPVGGGLLLAMLHSPLIQSVKVDLMPPATATLRNVRVYSSLVSYVGRVTRRRRRRRGKDKTGSSPPNSRAKTPTRVSQLFLTSAPLTFLLPMTPPNTLRSRSGTTPARHSQRKIAIAIRN